MKGKRQFSGILRGFDDYFNAVLEEVIEVWQQDNNKLSRVHDSILLNGHDIAYVICSNYAAGAWNRPTP